MTTQIIDPKVVARVLNHRKIERLSGITGSMLFTDRNETKKGSVGKIADATLVCVCRSRQQGPFREKVTAYGPMFFQEMPLRPASPGAHEVVV